MTDKNKNLILAVSAEEFTPVQGFLAFEDPIAELDDMGIIFGERGRLEKDPGYRQIIPYILMRQGGKFLTYVRGGNIEEARLRGRLAFGLGGHIDISDRVGVFGNPDAIDLKETIYHCAKREVYEEVGHDIYKADIQWRGLIVDHQDEVGTVHLGVVGVVDVHEDVVIGSHEPDAVTKLVFMTQDAVADLPPERKEGWTSIMAEVLHLL